jgi:hypothetical protein
MEVIVIAIRTDGNDGIVRLTGAFEDNYQTTQTFLEWIWNATRSTSDYSAHEAT